MIFVVNYDYATQSAKNYTFTIHFNIPEAKSNKIKIATEFVFASVILAVWDR